jgi:hypothetical protein
VPWQVAVDPRLKQAHDSFTRSHPSGTAVAFVVDGGPIIEALRWQVLHTSARTPDLPIGAMASADSRWSARGREGLRSLRLALIGA